MEMERLSWEEEAEGAGNPDSESMLTNEKLIFADSYEPAESTTAECQEFLPHSSGKKPIQFSDQFEGKTSFGMSVFNLSNAIMGSGVLGLAYAMSNTGVVLFVVLLVCIALLSAYSIHLLLKSAGFVGIRAYEQLGLKAFGQPGKVVAAVVISLHNIGAMSSYLYIVKYELPLVIQTFLQLQENNGMWYLDGKILIIGVSVVVILPLALMRQLGYLGYTSGFSLTCMVFFLIAIIYKKFQILCPLPVSGNETHPSMEMVYINGGNYTTDGECTAKLFTINTQTAYTIPILAFAFVCHPEVLPIYTELRSPTKQRMQKVANLSIMAMFVMYLTTAVFGYLTFYGTVEPELLHTYNRVDPLDTLILCVRLAVLLAVTLTVPVVLFPIRRAIQQLLFPGKAFHWARHVVIAIVLLFCVNLLVIFVPNIRDIFGIIGATTAPSLIFILPGLFYIRIIPNDKEALKSRAKVQALCFAIIGFVFMIMSLTFIVVDWTSGSEGSQLGGH
ncbi:sodium-coupled neutral amino acid transporter 5b [Pristis pectinata]|uniref:sodium-coupled neutral amino acid transporter 5b n=1 Tax=Pristis pectinata TaxID=685728 RepID=UPI00223E0170|nr:sodium-coupled neutral amino acid transporter 5b [Pristis pectinata]